MIFNVKQQYNVIIIRRFKLQMLCLKSFQLALETLTNPEVLKGQPPVEYLLDLTIGYPGAPARPLDILAIATGYRKPHVIHFHYR